MKQMMDILISFMLLVLVSPLFLITATVIRMQMGKPVVFKQKRPGLHGKPFYLYKFRTMENTIDRRGNELADEVRLTALGRRLRQFSLDELPQLINILKGDMNLVGPRPLLMEYLPLYTEEQAKRHNIKPGITGWAQVNGRNAITWEEKFALDTWYVANRTALLDCKILLLTFLKVVKKEGISQRNTATMEKFNGTKEVL